MTKKHFIALADVMRLKGCMPNAVDQAIHAAMNQGHDGLYYTEGTVPALTESQQNNLRNKVLAAVASELADFCADQNNLFDRHRWLGYIAGENGPNRGKR